MTSASNGSISLQQSVTPTKPPSCGFAQLVTEKSKVHTSWRGEDLNLRPSGYESGPSHWPQLVRTGQNASHPGTFDAVVGRGWPPPDPAGRSFAVNALSSSHGFRRDHPLSWQCQAALHDVGKRQSLQCTPGASMGAEVQPCRPLSAALTSSAVQHRLRLGGKPPCTGDDV
jgi:hypothetical protein